MKSLWLQQLSSTVEVGSLWRLLFIPTGDMGFYCLITKWAVAAQASPIEMTMNDDHDHEKASHIVLNSNNAAY